MSMNLMINDWIDTISYDRYESHVQQFIILSFFYLSLCNSHERN